MIRILIPIAILGILAVGIGVGNWSEVIKMDTFAGVENSDLLKVTLRKELDLPTPGEAVAVTWSADGKAIAAASNYGGDLTVWDRSGRVINQFKRIGGGPALEGSIAFVHGASQLVFPPPQNAADSASLAIWDIVTGQIVSSLPGPEPSRDYGLNRAAQFSNVPNKNLLAATTRGSGGLRNPNGNLITYSTQDWRVLWTATVEKGAYTLCAFDDGQLLAVGSNHGQVSILDAISGNLIHHFQAYEDSKFGTLAIGAIAGSPDGKLLLVGIGSGVFGSSGATREAQSWINSIDPLRVLRVEDGSLIASFDGGAMRPIRQAVWDPKGRFVAFIDNANGLFIWQPMSVKGSFKKIEVPGLGLSLAMAPDGSSLAVTDRDSIRIYSIN
jgi:WD40 repeat protein